MLVPVLWFAIPPAMVDYQNHLARMFVLARAGTAQAQPYYEVHWAIIPNFAMDLAVPRLGRLIGVETATRLFYLVSQILIVSGAMAIERVVKGRVQIAGYCALDGRLQRTFRLGFREFRVRPRLRALGHRRARSRSKSARGARGLAFIA